MVSKVGVLQQFNSNTPCFLYCYCYNSLSIQAQVPTSQNFKLKNMIKLEKRSLSANPDCSHLERLFRYFDEDGDGKISATELQSCVSSVGGELSPEEAVVMVGSPDSGGDGFLGFNDFVKLMEGNGKEVEEDLKEAFGMYVKDGCDFITAKSLKRMLSRLGESRTIRECEGMISVFDLDGDGVLNFDEFKIMMS